MQQLIEVALDLLLGLLFSSGVVTPHGTADFFNQAGGLAGINAAAGDPALDHRLEPIGHHIGGADSAHQQLLQWVAALHRLGPLELPAV